jgi:hypothetical protein
MDAKQLEQQLQQIFEQLITRIARLTNDAINKEPQQGNWTIGMLIQHVVLATAGLGDTHTKPADRAYDQYEGSIKETFTSPAKFQSPEFITPSKKQYDVQELLNELRVHRDELVTSIREKDLSLQCMDIEAPGWGYLTRYEWLVLIIYHVQRHTEQLKNLIANQEKQMA